MRATTYFRAAIGVVFLVLTIQHRIWWWTVAFSALALLAVLMHYQKRLDDHAWLAFGGMLALLLAGIVSLGMGASEFLARWPD